MKNYTVLDLFSGCGGMSLGFEQAGFNIKLGIDNCQDALATFESNHHDSKILNADLSQLNPSIIANNTFNTDIDLVIGGPPCQGFSIAGKRIIDDSRNQLYRSFVRFVKYFKPKAFVMENVPNILSMGKGTVKDNILRDFQKLGYNVSYKVLLASDFGVPQNRKRAIFIGTQKSDHFSFPTGSEEKITSKDAISDLPENSVNDGASYQIKPSSLYQKQMRHASLGIFNHTITQHMEKTIQTIAMVPDGGNYKDLPQELHKTRKVNIAWTRLNSERPSFTIDTGHRHHFHYLFNRVPTVRESARIQSFPDNFVFKGSKTSQYKQVGNAVPPLLAKALANNMREYL